jgi:hypothetical protein
MSLIITGCYGQCSSTMNKPFEELLWATLITAMLWALLIYEAMAMLWQCYGHLIGNMEAEDTEGVWVFQPHDWHAAEEEEEDPEGYAYEYEDDMGYQDQDEPEYALDMGRPRQRYAGVKKRPGLQGF